MKTGLSILLIDDDKEMTDEVSEILVDNGYRVTVANDGLHGDALLSSDSFNVVMLDLKMPGLDGISILKRLKERKSDARVIIVTARPLGGDLLHGAGALTDEDHEMLKKAFGVIIKPYDIEAMLKMVREAMEA